MRRGGLWLPWLQGLHLGQCTTQPCPPAPSWSLLQYPLDKIAIAIYYMIFKGLKANNIRHIPTPPPTSSGTPWCAWGCSRGWAGPGSGFEAAGSLCLRTAGTTATTWPPIPGNVAQLLTPPLPPPATRPLRRYVEEGLSAEEIAALTSRMTAKLYASKKKEAGAGAAKQGAAAAAGAAAASRGGRPAASVATAGGAASTMMLGACESVAYSGAGTVVGGGISDLAEHTSVPRPLSSEAGSGAGSKRPAADSPAGGGPGPTALSPADAVGSSAAAHVTKRARHEEPAAAAAAATCNEATSAKMRTPASNNSTPAFSAVAAAAPTVPAAVKTTPQATPAGPAADDSEKEEGELEEGELA